MDRFLKTHEKDISEAKMTEKEYEEELREAVDAFLKNHNFNKSHDLQEKAEDAEDELMKNAKDIFQKAWAEFKKKAWQAEDAVEEAVADATKKQFPGLGTSTISISSSLIKYFHCFFGDAFSF